MGEPVDLSERSIQNLTSGIVAGLNGRSAPTGGTNTSSSSSGGGRSWGDDVGRLFTGANNLVSSVGLLTQGTYGLSQATGDIGKVIGMFGPVGQGLAQFGEGVVGIAIDTNKTMMDVSKSGFGFSQNLGLFASSVLGAQMSMPGFKRMIEDSGKSLAGLSGTASNSAIGYLRMLQEINENKDLYGARVSGLDDFDQTLRLSASMSRNLNMQDAASKKSVIDSAVAMGIEMDNIARLTGKSRQEQQKAMETQMQKNEMEIMLMAMTAEEEEIYKDNLTAMGKYGKGFSDVMTEMTVGQGDIVSEKGTKIAAALDQISPGITALMSKAATETDAVRRKQLQDEIDVRMARLAQDKNALKELAVITAQGKNDVGNIAGELVAGSKQYMLVLDKAQKEAARTGEDVNVVMARAKEQFAKDRLKPGDPGADPNANASKVINQADIFFKQASAGWGSALEGLNTKAGTFIQNLEGLNKVFTARTQAEIALLPSELKKQLGYTGVATNTSNVSQRYQAEVPKPAGKALGDDFIPAGWQGFVGEKGPEFLKVGAQSSVKSNTVSMGLLDQAVTKLPAMMSGMQNELKLAMHEAKSNMPSAKDFDSLFGNFKTTFSSQTNEGTTQNKPADMFNNEASSALQKGIDMLNTSVKQLITAVEDGTSKNVKAVKSKGNMLA